jgi:membrane associated rhomboid family serine protease
MIIPIGHEESTVRRLPWVSFTIIGICVIAFGLTHVSTDAFEQAQEKLEEAVLYYYEHPYLQPDERIIELLSEGQTQMQAEALLEIVKQFGEVKPEDPAVIAEEQAHLDALTAAAFGFVAESPYHRWGLIPAQKTLHGLVTYMFMHGGWMHLIGNMLFLFLAGPCIEDAWGRPVFAAFYIGGGLFAGLLYALRYPEFEGPLIGASGAVAALMGAFAIRFWKTKIKFFWWYWFRMGTFNAPAWLVLPVWLLRELVYADAVDVSGQMGGVAHWAHIFGFGAGAAVAFGMMYFKVEERFIHDKIESKITLVENTAIEDAMEAFHGGKLDEAERILKSELQTNPNNTDACIAFWNLLVAAERGPEAAPVMLRVIRRAAQNGDVEELKIRWPELLQVAPQARIDSAMATRVAEMFDGVGDREECESAIAVAAQALGADPPVGIMTRLARLASATKSNQARDLIRQALEHAELPSDARAELKLLEQGLAEEGLEVVSAAAPEEQSNEPVVAEVERVRHHIKVMEARPIAIEGMALQIEAGGSRRRLDLENVQALAVAGVTRPDGRSVLLIDLLLDAPWSEQEALRIVRCYSNAFDPRRIVGGDNAGQAFRVLVDRIIELSEAVPLPDPDAARGQPFATFASLDEYQQQVLDAFPES